MILVTILCASALPLRAADDIVIIVSPDNRVTKIADTDLKMIYLGEKKQWEDGRAIITVDLEENNSIRERFVNIFLSRSVASLKYYWIQQIFTGRGVPPLELKNERQIIEYVASHPGSIGYIEAHNLDSSVNRVSVTGSR